MAGLPKHAACLLSGVRQLSTSSLLSAAVPALATRPSGGLFGSSRVSVPLSEPLPGVISVKHEAPPAKLPDLQIVSTPGGTKVAAQPLPGPLATVAVYASSGSVYESAATAGASQFLQALAFKASTHRTTFRVTRELEKFGLVPGAVAGREYLGFTLQGVKFNVPEAVEVLLDTVLNPRLNDWEVSDLLYFAQDAVAETLKNPLATVAEVLHRAAFTGSLGQPLVPDPSALAKLNGATLREFVASTITPSSIVLVGAGVEAEQLKSLAGPLLAEAGPAAATPPASSYVGGTLNCIATSGESYAAVAFEAKGGASSPTTVAAAAVFSALLSDAVREPLPYLHKELPKLTSLTPVASLYKSTGLVGLAGSMPPGSTSALVDELSKRLEAAAGASEAQVRAAKALAAVKHRSALASQASLAHELGTQLLATGKFSGAEQLAKIQSLTVAEYQGAVKTLLKTPPTLVTYGNLVDLPRADVLAKRFGA